MKLVFVSNMLNHHQIMLCNELNKVFEDFIFIVVENLDNIGCVRAQEAEYVLYHYLPEERAKAEWEIMNADVVIFGACSNKMIELRMQYDKLSFLYSERFFKKGTWRRFLPKTRKCVFNRIIKYKTKNIYVLCASAYMSHDLALLGFPLKKCYKWGYFPETKEQDIDVLFQRKKNNKIVSILWVGRLIKLKHPDYAVHMAEYLRKKGYKFKLNIIGEGDLEKKLNQLIRDKNLSNCVHLLGGMSPEKVRIYMEASDIFLFTSDYREGWGAVLNESMNSGCAVIASHSAGAVPFLVKNGENGLIYENGNLDELNQKMVTLIEDSSQRERYGRRAYQMLIELWNARTSAERLRHMVNVLAVSGDSSELYNEGPCSLAEDLDNRWYSDGGVIKEDL